VALGTEEGGAEGLGTMRAYTKRGAKPHDGIERLARVRWLLLFADRSKTRKIINKLEALVLHYFGTGPTV
jgi:hypothetical protein